MLFRSEDAITEESAEKFIARIIKSGHESVLEHASASFRIVTNRYTTHQIVRHRLFSYSQESQRYCNYGSNKFGDIAFVTPIDLVNRDHDIRGGYLAWQVSCKKSESTYLNMIHNDISPQVARSVLPSSCKTEIVMTGNFRSWRHFLKLRCSTHAQVDVRYLANEIRSQLRKAAPTAFGDL